MFLKIAARYQDFKWMVDIQLAANSRSIVNERSDQNACFVNAG
jgi:hypothetical protein